LELGINQPTHIKLLFDEPIVGESQYGKYYLYAVSNGSDREYSLFAADAVHEVLKDHGKGTEAIITKLAAQRGKKLVTTYDVQIVESNKVDSAMHNQNNPTDKYLTIMEECFEHASRIQKRFNSVNLNQIAITLFIQKSKAIGLTN